MVYLLVGTFYFEIIVFTGSYKSHTLHPISLDGYILEKDSTRSKLGH